ncbi:GNAT family N-acetyltransferase [Hahella aquimaris]|uniref:GNAT family N-acetyltransferase n=1 Tax=Hahella sp. HNIBRBA332 TaxID=3015983 RepID=UPI00273CCB45|nr:GNAT family N-acetyltransferase [Hahella sp. HNIBRBA332]WLQ14211.1 GNAT family N-acetyltransferase [Hahella sp. HNIBRBA332]
MDRQLVVKYLADAPEAVPALAASFETEWPDWYGPQGPGDAEADLRQFCSRDALPVGMVAFWGGELVGVAALKAQSIATHPHLGPWAAAGWVKPELRRRGLGAALLTALEGAALALGYNRLYCGTATSASLMRRCGWRFLEELHYHGEKVGLYCKALGAADVPAS